MVAMNMSLVSILGILTVIVVICLVMDYYCLLRRPARLGLWVALLGIIVGFFFTLKAVLPDNHFYGPVFHEVKTRQKVVALTFDDGPYPPYTGQVLDILKEYQVPATFFVLGKNVEKYPELVRRIVAEGHQLGNHTYSHVDLLKVERQVIVEEIDKTSQAVKAATGLDMQVMRPPHGFRDAVVMEIVTERKLQVVGWSVMSRDWTNPGADEIAERTISKVRSGSVVLLHDGDGVAQAAPRTQTVEATRRIIRELSAQGYKFVTVSEILAATED